MPMFTREFIRDDGTQVEVDGSYRILDDTVEFNEYSAWLWTDRNNPSAPCVELTDAEDQRLNEEIVADPDTWEYPDDFAD